MHAQLRAKSPTAALTSLSLCLSLSIAAYPQKVGRGAPGPHLHLLECRPQQPAQLPSDCAAAEGVPTEGGAARGEEDEAEDVPARDVPVKMVTRSRARDKRVYEF